MIQFNLLPDVKKEYIKTKRIKRLISTVASIASLGSIVIVVVLFSFVQIGQKGKIDGLTKDIDKELVSLKSIQDLDKILTIQNQLQALPALHENKPETSRLFTYLTQLTPAKLTISTLSLNVINSKLTISGRADTLATINQFADTLKFSTYKIKDQEDEKAKPFSNVISRLNRDKLGASYTIDLDFDPIIFDNTKDVILVVPNIETTRSATNKPGEALPLDKDVFDDSPAQEGAQ